MTEITPASILDLGALRHLEQVCFPQDAWPLLDLIAVLSFPGVVRLKAIENGKMIGFIAGDPRPGEDLGWIATIGVLPNQRGKGIGRALLAACERQMPLSRIRLSVRQSNHQAIRMYEQAGYRSVDHWLRYYNDGEDALVMEKRIEKTGL
ncbi:MAG: GNAT family N-acetyltransferase [Anaerolineae bacterium]|nr:GNAT family N-acetyltransferase [Anaerolineae bacterium]